MTRTFSDRVRAHCRRDPCFRQEYEHAHYNGALGARLNWFFLELRIERHRSKRLAAEVDRLHRMVEGREQVIAALRETVEEVLR